MIKLALRLLLVLMLLVCLAPVARAESTPEQSEALRLKQDGDRAYGARRFADALDIYGRSYALYPDPRVLFNLSRALTALARFAEALEQLERFEQAASAELKGQVPELPQLFAELRVKVATLTIRTPVQGARVFLGGRALGRTPLGTLRVDAGSKELEVLSEGYLPYKRRVDLPGGLLLELDLELIAKDKAGLLRITSSATGASVSIDGQRLGGVPAEAALGPGLHRVRVSHPDYNEAQLSVVIRAGERKEIPVDLARPRAITSRWWFWAGVGTVVASGVAIVIALNTERAAGEGDIPPGQVSAPLLAF